MRAASSRQQMLCVNVNYKPGLPDLKYCNLNLHACCVLVNCVDHTRYTLVRAHPAD